MANAMQGVEVEFRDLTEEAQERLYLSDKARFQNEAANSIYCDIRILVARNEEVSSEFLNAMLREEITNKNKQDEDVIKAILSNKKLLLENYLRNACAKSANWEIRLMIAKDAKTQIEILEAMRERECNAYVINAIDTNLSNKEKNKQMLEVLKGFISSENEAAECLEKIKAIIY